MSKRLDLANQQLLGYYFGKWKCLIDMIQEMALTKKEWLIIKKDYEPYLDLEDIKEVDSHFGLS